MDADVVRLIQDAVHRERRPTKHIINDALRRALTTTSAATEPYRLTPHESGVRPGLDLTGFNRLLDELDDAAVVGTGRATS